MSTAGGTLPRWSIGSKELFYIGLDDWMMSVPILGLDGESMRLGAPERLFPSRMAYRNIEHTFLYAVAEDGQPFLVEQTSERVATLTVGNGIGRRRAATTKASYEAASQSPDSYWPSVARVRMFRGVRLEAVPPAPSS